MDPELENEHADTKVQAVVAFWKINEKDEGYTQIDECIHYFCIPNPLFTDKVLFRGSTSEVYFFYENEHKDIVYSEVDLAKPEQLRNLSNYKRREFFLKSTKEAEHVISPESTLYTLLKQACVKTEKEDT